MNPDQNLVKNDCTLLNKTESQNVYKYHEFSVNVM